MLSKVIMDRVDEICMDRVDELCMDKVHQFYPWKEFINSVHVDRVEYIPHNTYELKLKLKEIYTTN